MSLFDEISDEDMLQAEAQAMSNRFALGVALLEEPGVLYIFMQALSKNEQLKFAMASKLNFKAIIAKTKIVNDYKQNVQEHAILTQKWHGLMEAMIRFGNGYDYKRYKIHATVVSKEMLQVFTEIKKAQHILISLGKLRFLFI